ncbi:MAG: efflux RND transporter periplasmic adaptor subunit [Candidatus Coatesbacteria bacterium]|nr:efflux RND transporter periplasmic adaptor subunit [Candidatus Coatesbacteria bacterium]
MQRKGIALTVVTAALAAGLVLLAGCGGGGRPESEEESPIPVAATVVRLEPTTIQRDLSGILRGRMEANVAPEVSGRLNKIYVEVGDEVTKGQALAVMDGSQYWLSSQSTKGQMETARLQLEQAEDNYERYQPLYEAGQISKSQWDQIVNAYEMAQAGYDAAKAGYYQVTDMAAETTIRAPFSGVVAFRNADIGSMVGPSMVVFQVIQSDPMTVTIGVDENDIRYLTEGAEVDVRVEAYPGETFSGTVRAIGSKLETATFTFPVEVELPNEDGRLKSGMVAHVVLPIRDLGEAISVPLNAVVELAGVDYVYVVKEVQRQEPRPSANQLRVGDEVVELNSLTEQIAAALDDAGTGAGVTIESADKLYTLELTGIDEPSQNGDPGTELRVERREVVKGSSLGDRIVVEEGLEPGERIITEGQQFLEDGSLITLPDETTAADEGENSGGENEAAETESTETTDEAGEEAA